MPPQPAKQRGRPRKPIHAHQAEEQHTSTSAAPPAESSPKCDTFRLTRSKRKEAPAPTTDPASAIMGGRGKKVKTDTAALAMPVNKESDRTQGIYVVDRMDCSRATMLLMDRGDGLSEEQQAEMVTFFLEKPAAANTYLSLYKNETVRRKWLRKVVAG